MSRPEIAGLSEEVALDLIGALGQENVILTPERLAEVAGDWTEVTPGRAAAIVRAGSVGDLRKLLTIAGPARIPIVPMVANSNIGGLAVPAQGGIVLDLRGMDRIVEVNEADLYMLIEPGVTWRDVKDRLDADHPGLDFGYSLALPDSSILLNCLLDGLTTLGLKHGPTGDWLNGLEVLLPDGTLVRTGAAAMGGTWCSDSPAPGLTGLFVNAHGTTGIVTKAAVRLYRKPAFRTRSFTLAYDVDEAVALVRALVREDICDDIGGLTWPIGKMIFGEKKPRWRDPEEPLFFVYSDVAAPRERTFLAKEAVQVEVIEELRRSGARLSGPLDVEDILRIEPAFSKFAVFPTRLDFLIERGGLTWIGTYGPLSRWQEGISRGMELMERRGFPPLVVTRPMSGGHFGVLRFVMTFDKADAAEVQAVRELNAELSDLTIDLGFVTYKTPPWLLRRHRDRIDPGFLKLFAEVRSLIDPDGILNPGKWSP